jgi:hypothetical protein
MEPGDWHNIDPLPLPFLVMLVFWLTLLFGSFGLFAPGTFRSSPRFGLCTVAVSAGVGLIIDTTDPFSGIVRVSSGPLRQAIEHQTSLAPNLLKSGLTMAQQIVWVTPFGGSYFFGR